MNSTRQKQTSLKVLLACLVLLGTQLSTQTFAREMQPGSDAFNFSTYMIDAFYSEGEECAEKLLTSPTIGWLCAAFPLGPGAFEQRWDAYLSALPQSYNITAVSAWGDIRYEEDDSVFYGKLYDLNDGRLVVGYDQEDRGREIRLGFSSTANQATAEQRKLALANEQARAAQVAQAQAAQAAQTQAAQAAQTMQVQQNQPVQQEPVFLTQEETRARELAQAEYEAQIIAQQQATAQQQEIAQQQAMAQQQALVQQQTVAQQQTTAQVNQAATQQTGTFQSYNSQTGLNTNTVPQAAVPQTTQITAPQTAVPLTNQRAYATQQNTANSSTAMSNAATTTMATSEVVNPTQDAATSSTAMTNATTTNLATSSVVTATPQQVVANMSQASMSQAPVEQAIAQAPVQTPIKQQEVMALAQPKQAPQAATALTASGILDVFREKGLSVSAAKEMTPQDYGFAPVLASEGLFFRLGDCTSCIGRIFSFDRKEDVAMMEVYYSLEAQATDVVYSQDKVLLQFFSTPKDLAEQYISELKALN